MTNKSEGSENHKHHWSGGIRSHIILVLGQSAWELDVESGAGCASQSVANWVEVSNHFKHCPRLYWIGRRSMCLQSWFDNKPSFEILWEPELPIQARCCKMLI